MHEQARDCAFGSEIATTAVAPSQQHLKKEASYWQTLI